ncbi:MetQ/NlpA family ABC transporter substrate-binding protein [Brachyspira hyodysenteriae]|uniref:MetQ/NlpA family ABC transporter substrate-binding protein n=1 Tax=Brachyspira hyodysenteriae TaxID=159 RepID=UPI0022CD7184|nr:MetQ/NlpA family ABC transporter substrate-binding protein [Brachyspira hyodysenteriae]MCZ9838278.1 MetQ/NlpA family ABC transporter substrate-binding protein [Brachyspira hyodysenteriae]MCZ9849389.1 MetQ/NlpA family ABC transporter substrate-binding protein [Brachyspira hyodysenteriae]MCZ9850322.1 MetQ/NlpA family ABC transporter substrate-binding protein [Brachyspira hyodysenteriae]MCZ9860925.1 MetQ/NlpA family ABC transporter substrate-binding protein [Brachyspira hyodysenteriae]MCZ98708
MKSLLIFFLLINILSCNDSNIDIIKVGHIGEFDYDIWQKIDEELQIENAKLDLVYFEDYEILNKALNDGDIDLNSFQNYLYFVNETNKYNYNLHILGKTFVAPMNIYSKFITNINQISSNAKIAIPDDEVNLSRALQILEVANIIKLERFDKNFYNTNNISENKLNIQIIPMDAGMIYYYLDKVDAAVINYGFISDYVNYNIIFHDDIKKYNSMSMKSYVNLIVCREKDKHCNLYRFIAESYKQKIKKYIQKNMSNGLITTY